VVAATGGHSDWRSQQQARAARRYPFGGDTFVKQVAMGNQFEIDTSKLALSKSNSADVKSFAAQMVKGSRRRGHRSSRT